MVEGQKVDGFGAAKSASTSHSQRGVGAVKTETIFPKFLDGPWLRHPNEILGTSCTSASARYPIDIGTKEYHALKKRQSRHVRKMVHAIKVSDRQKRLIGKYGYAVPSGIDAGALSKLSGEEKEEAIEQCFVHCDMFLAPGTFYPSGALEKFSRDWAANARGIYYRHFYSPYWLTGNRELWIPTLVDRIYDHAEEGDRRARARTFLNHTLDNERWSKSEYAWEADAWSDVFGHMRNDPALAADKHEYYTRVPEVYPVTHTMNGKSKFSKRIPDATFGLATFRPEHYQTPVASYDLDAERLQALMLHRSCGIISDPKYGEADMAFPFAVYEAKSWAGDPREARIQACTAGAAYLDMLDSLGRVPDSAGVACGAYQFGNDSRSGQIFAITSFGSHWNVMVGHRRRRLKREHSEHPGMSENVYLFQRVWSGCITNEEKAWQLLCLVDQIHLWGVTNHREWVIRHLQAWHEYCRRVWIQDAMLRHEEPSNFPSYNCMAFGNINLPEWTGNFSLDFQAHICRKSDDQLNRISREDVSVKPFVRCHVDQCGEMIYPQWLDSAHFSPEETLGHWAKAHGVETTDDLEAWPSGSTEWQRCRSRPNQEGRGNAKETTRREASTFNM